MKNIASFDAAAFCSAPAIAADMPVKAPVYKALSRSNSIKLPKQNMLRKIWRLAATGDVLKLSLIAAIIVGSILILINQYDALFGHIAFNWYKASLTYCVPYLVSTYGAVTAKWVWQTDVMGQQRK